MVLKKKKSEHRHNYSIFNKIININSWTTILTIRTTFNVKVSKLIKTYFIYNLKIQVKLQIS